MRVTVRESEPSDIYDLAARLREGDLAEVVALGVEPRHAIRRSYRHAILRRTYLVDNEVAAMSGLCGAMLSDIGEPYLMTAHAAAKVPVAFLKLAKQAVAEMLVHRGRLEGHVAASYLGACRLLEVLGFRLGEPFATKPHGVLFRSFVLRRAD